MPALAAASIALLACAAGAPGGPRLLRTFGAGERPGAVAYPPYGGPYEADLDVAFVVVCAERLEVTFSAFDVDPSDAVTLNGRAIAAAGAAASEGVADNVVRFVSDGAGAGGGFVFTYTCTKARGACAVDPVAAAAGESGEVVYPAPPAVTYPNNAVVCWEVRCAAGPIGVEFVKLDIRDDELSINGVRQHSIYTVGPVFDVAVPPPFRTEGSTAAVRFASNYFTRGSGIHFRWTCCPPGACAPGPSPTPAPAPATVPPTQKPAPATSQPVPVPATSHPVPVPATSQPVPVPATSQPVPTLQPVPPTSQPVPTQKPAPATSHPVPVPAAATPVPRPPEVKPPTSQPVPTLQPVPATSRPVEPVPASPKTVPPTPEPAQLVPAATPPASSHPATPAPTSARGTGAPASVGGGGPVSPAPGDGRRSSSTAAVAAAVAAAVVAALAAGAWWWCRRRRAGPAAVSHVYGGDIVVDGDVVRTPPSGPLLDTTVGLLEDAVEMEAVEDASAVKAHSRKTARYRKQARRHASGGVEDDSRGDVLSWTPMESTLGGAEGPFIAPAVPSSQPDPALDPSTSSSHVLHPADSPSAGYRRGGRRRLSSVQGATHAQGEGRPPADPHASRELLLEQLADASSGHGVACNVSHEAE